MFDRRRFGRFQVAEDDFQLIRQNTSTIGWIRDIGRHGLSYEYIAVDKQQGEIEDIGIFSDKHRRSIFLPGLSCKVVYDINEDEDPRSYSVFNFRRRGLKYRSITRGQKERLLSLINNVSDNFFETVGETKG